MVAWLLSQLKWLAVTTDIANNRNLYDIQSPLTWLAVTTDMADKNN